MGLGAKEHHHGLHSYSTVFDVRQPCDWLEPNKKGPGASKLTCLRQPCGKASMGLAPVLCHVLKTTFPSLPLD